MLASGEAGIRLRPQLSRWPLSLPRVGRLCSDTRGGLRLRLAGFVLPPTWTLLTLELEYSDLVLYVGESSEEIRRLAFRGRSPNSFLTSDFCFSFGKAKSGK